MLSRRRFVAGVASGLVLSEFAGPSSLCAATAQLKLSEARRKILLAALEKEDRRFDPFARMLVTSAPSPVRKPSARTGDVHSTRPSLAYAAALLESGQRWRTERAKEILRVVLSLQNQEIASFTHGLWPAHLEEPRARISGTHWSNSVFCAGSLLITWIYHRPELGEPLGGQVQEALLHAARAWQKQQVPFDETASAVAAAGFALGAAQEFKLPGLRALGKAQLKKVQERILQEGSFAKDNSPLDCITLLQELSRILLLVRDARDRALASALQDLAWQHVATHFHPPTQQWAGPHRLNDEIDLRRSPAILAFLQTASADRVRFEVADPVPLGLEAALLPLECPRKWIKYFNRLDPPRQVIETFVRAAPGRPGANTPLVGTTWLHPRFTLGTVNRGHLGLARHPMIAYWGTPDAPRYLRLRCLKNGQDLSSALLYTAQHEGAMLAVVTFATDRDEDRPGGASIEPAAVGVKDVRLRFEFGGELGKLTADTRDGAERYFLLQDHDVQFILRPVADAFGADRFQWDSPNLQLARHIDSVAYTGAEESIDLSNLEQAFLCFTLEEWPYDVKTPPLAKVITVQTEGRLRARWSAGGKALDLDVPVRPAGAKAMNDSFQSRVV